MNFSRFFSPLLLLALGFVATGCMDDDDDARRNDFCLEPSEISGCVELATLSEAQHFNQLVGTWTLAAEFGGLRPPGTDDCNLLGPDAIVQTFRADSTWTWSNGSGTRSGDWAIRTETNNGQERTFLDVVTTTDFTFLRPDFRCDDGLGRSEDARPVDGSVLVYTVE